MFKPSECICKVRKWSQVLHTGMATGPVQDPRKADMKHLCFSERAHWGSFKLPRLIVFLFETRYP